MATGNRLVLRCFLEGVEVPVISAHIMSQKNSPCVCSLQIPANDYAMDLRPRTLVHLFVFDLYNGVPPAEQVSVGGPGVRTVERDGVDPELIGIFPTERFESSPEQDLVDLENENYKLIFGGEVMGIQYSKQPHSRSVVLQCADWSSYWDIAYQYQIGGFSLGGGGIRAAFTGASTTVFNDFLEGSADIVTRLMQTAPRTYPSLKGTLLGGITHIIEAIGGTYFGKRAVRGVNDFFSLAEMRLHLTQMLGANPFPEKDELRLLRANHFGSLFKRTLSGLGRLVTIRAVLLALQRYIFHEIIPINAPRYLPPAHDPALPQHEVMGIEEDEETRPLGKAARAVKSRAEELKERQQSSMDAEEARTQSERRGGLQNELKKVIKICNQAATRSKQVGLRGGSQTRLADFFGIPEVTKAFSVAGNSFSQLLESLKTSRRTTARGIQFQTFGSKSSDSVLRILDQVILLMQQVIESRHNRRVQRRTVQPDPPPRLLTQIYRPDVWMVAPPRCNVIFPELYSQFSYGRNFQREVTRMLLRTHSAFFGSDILFDGFYMAPSRLLGQRRNKNIARGRIGKSPDLSDAPAWVVRDMMEHELFTGIVPAFERMSDLNLHALRGGATLIDGVKVSYAQLACNHIFFQYRFKSRELMLTGKFNPYCVLGFPMLVIDKYLPQDALKDGTYDAALAAKLAEATREGEGEIGPPSEERQRIHEANNARVADVQAEILAGRPNTHYLGTPASITHTLDARSGGTTAVQMEYARTTNERTEFLGDNIGRNGKARRVRNVRRTTNIAAFSPPQLDTLGYYGGRIIEVTEVTDKYTRRVTRKTNPSTSTQGRGLSSSDRRSGSTTLPLFVPDRKFTGRRRRGTRVRVGIEQPAIDYGPEVVSLVGTTGDFNSSSTSDREILVTFHAYQIVEEIGAYQTEEVELAPEDLTFPPWYGETYRSNRIGSLYSYFFGTGALTDPLTILEPGVSPSQYQAATAPPDPEAQQRTKAIQFIERFSEVVGGAVARLDSGPPPGESTPLSLPDGELAGPAGDVVDQEVEGLLAQIKGRSPIALATEEVVRAYSKVKLRNYDVHEFLRSYTWRPIASMVDMFGTANLEIDDDGNVVRGREGFHSRAFGDYDDLRQLVGNSSGSRPQTILGLTTRDPDETGDGSRADRDAKIAARMDTRREKRIAVIKYIYALGSSCGTLG